MESGLKQDDLVPTLLTGCSKTSRRQESDFKGQLTSFIDARKIGTIGDADDIHIIAGSIIGATNVRVK